MTEAGSSNQAAGQGQATGQAEGKRRVPLWQATCMQTINRSVNRGGEGLLFVEFLRSSHAVDNKGYWNGRSNWAGG